MLAFQIIVDLFCLYAALRVVQKIKTRAISSRWGFFWLVFWLGVGAVISLPWTTSLLAARLGVTRGVDLVVYVSVIALFYLIFRLTLKIERLERNITKLVREIALKNRSNPGVIPSPSGRSVQDEESRR
jgi:small membrane protein